MNTCGNVKSTALEYVHEIKFQYNCDTSNVVYMLECRTCGMRYIGETYQPIKVRINQHRWDVKAGRDTSVAKHFEKPGHNFDEIKIYILELGFSSRNERKLREAFFIRKFNTQYPAGINVYKGRSEGSVRASLKRK